MTMTKNDTRVPQQRLIPVSEIRMGDFIRWDNAGYAYAAQWWKVLEIDDFQIIIMNEVMTTRTVLKADVGVVRLHPYSNKWNR